MADIHSSHDNDYQLLFKDKGIRKANDVLQYVDEEFRRLINSNIHDRNDNDWLNLRRSTAIVSIGGADGSELLTLMKNLDSPYGILVEISPTAASAARASGIDTVIQDDVMDAAPEVISQLYHWQNQGEISTVLISCQSVLHELPTRSATFTKEAFLQNYLTPLMSVGLRIMFYAREPCPPSNWLQMTDAIGLRLPGFTKNRLMAVANYISEELTIPSSVDLTNTYHDDTRVVS